MRVRTLVATLFVSLFLWSSSAEAQQRHIVQPEQMRQAIAEQAAVDQQTREAVLGVLAHSQVREMASRLGLSVTRAESAVATLTSAELASIAEPARAAEAQLAGGNTTVVISLTTLLLIIIIVILLAD